MSPVGICAGWGPYLIVMGAFCSLYHSMRVHIVPNRKLITMRLYPLFYKKYKKIDVLKKW